MREDTGMKMTSRSRDDRLIASRLGDLVAGVCFLLAVILAGVLLAWYAVTNGQELLIAAGFYAVVALVLVPTAVLLISRWSYLILDFSTLTYRLKPSLRAQERGGPIDSQLRVILRHERRLTRGHAVYGARRPYDLYSVVVDGIHTEPIIIEQSRSPRHAGRFAAELAEACGVDLAQERIDQAEPMT